MVGLDSRLLGRNALVCQVVRVNLQRYTLLVGCGSDDGLILLLGQLLLETIVRAHAKVIGSGVDGALGAETAVGGILWARCRESRVVRTVRDSPNGLVFRVVDLMMASLED